MNEKDLVEKVPSIRELQAERDVSLKVILYGAL